MRLRIISVLSIVFIACSAFYFFKNEKPVLYIIGDSTVRNGDGTGKGNLWGWASVIDPFFDTAQLAISNQAIGGRSSRTFLTEGRWDKVLATLKAGDFVMMQFGHNDASPLDDTARARGTIKGVGTDSVEIYNPIRKMEETVYSYGYYMRKFVRETKAKGATPIVCSLVPRNNWKEGKVTKSNGNNYAGWAETVAKEEGAYYIDINKTIADRYETLGKEKVDLFFPSDHTHTNREGAELNAAIVVQELKTLNLPSLTKYLR